MSKASSRVKKSAWYRILSATIVFILTLSLAVPPGFAQMLPNLPPPGVMVTMSPGFTPAVIRGMKVFADNPLQFDFIVDRGDSGLKGDALKSEGEKLIKYFMAALTVPEQELWVNLSPYEDGKIIPQSFGVTDMGRDLLAQDYILKQLTSSLMYPEDALGKKFWDRVYKKANELFGTTEIPVNTFNKIWIVPEKAVVFEQGDMAFIAESHMKVMLEEDYLSIMNNLGNKERGTDRLKEDEVKALSTLSSQIVKEVLIPEIEKEVNEGKNFANLRQIYHSMILATWYKVNLKESLLGKVYVDQNKTLGIDIADKDSKQKIYEQYLEAFKKGVYNYIKEDLDPATQEIIPRKYFSGGFDGVNIARAVQRATNRAMLSSSGQQNIRLVEQRASAPQTPGDEQLVYMRSQWIENVRPAQAGLVQPQRRGADRAMTRDVTKEEEDFTDRLLLAWLGNDAFVTDGSTDSSALKDIQGNLRALSKVLDFPQEKQYPAILERIEGSHLRRAEPSAPAADLIARTKNIISRRITDIDKQLVAGANRAMMAPRDLDGEVAFNPRTPLETDQGEPEIGLLAKTLTGDDITSIPKAVRPTLHIGPASQRTMVEATRYYQDSGRGLWEFTQGRDRTIVQEDPTYNDDGVSQMEIIQRGVETLQSLGAIPHLTSFGEVPAILTRTRHPQFTFDLDRLKGSVALNDMPSLTEDHRRKILEALDGMVDAGIRVSLFESGFKNSGQIQEFRIVPSTGQVIITDNAFLMAVNGAGYETPEYLIWEILDEFDSLDNPDLLAGNPVRQAASAKAKRDFAFIREHFEKRSQGGGDLAMMGDSNKLPVADDWGYREWPGVSLLSSERAGSVADGSRATFAEVQRNFDRAMTGSSGNAKKIRSGFLNGLQNIAGRRFTISGRGADAVEDHREFLGRLLTLPSVNDQRAILSQYAALLERNQQVLRQLPKSDVDVITRLKDGVQFGYYKGNHFTSYPAEELLALNYVRQFNAAEVQKTTQSLMRDIPAVTAEDDNFMPRVRAAARQIVDTIQIKDAAGQARGISAEIREQVEDELVMYLSRELLLRDKKNNVGESRRLEVSDVTARDGNQSVRGTNVSGYYMAGIVGIMLKNKAFSAFEGGGGATVQVAMMKGRRTIAPIKVTYKDESGKEVTETPPESPFFNLYRNNLVNRQVLVDAVGKQRERISSKDWKLLMDRYERKEDRKILFDDELEELLARTTLTPRVKDEVRRIYKIKQEILERGENGFGLDEQPPENIREGVRLMFKNGADVIRVFDATNDIDSMRGAIDEAIRVGARVQPALTYGHKVPNAVEKFTKMAQEVMGLFQGDRRKYLDTLVIKDVGGVMEEGQARQLVRSIRSAGFDGVLHLHTHDTSGNRILTIFEAIRANGDEHPIRIDVGLGALSAPYGQVDGDALANLLKDTNWEGNLRLYDYEVSKQAQEYIRGVVGGDVEVSTERRKAIIRAGIPGGMWTNFLVNVLEGLQGRASFIKGQFGITVIDEKKQLTTEGRAIYEALIDSVLEEQENVHRDVGYIPLGTPTSDWVGKQALNNVTSWLERSGNRDAKDNVIPDADKLIKYESGKFVKQPALSAKSRVEQYGPFWPGLQNFLMRRAQSPRLADWYPTVNPDVIRKAFSAKGIDVELDQQGLVRNPDALKDFAKFKPVLGKRFVDLPTIRLREEILTKAPLKLAALEKQWQELIDQRSRGAEILREKGFTGSLGESSLAELENKILALERDMAEVKSLVSNETISREAVTQYALNPALGIPLTFDEGSAHKLPGQTSSPEDTYLRVTQPAPNLAPNLFAWRKRLDQLIRQTGDEPQRESFKLSLKATGTVYDLESHRRSLELANGKKKIAQSDRAMNAKVPDQRVIGLLASQGLEETVRTLRINGRRWTASQLQQRVKLWNGYDQAGPYYDEKGELMTGDQVARVVQFNRNPVFFEVNTGGFIVSKNPVEIKDKAMMSDVRRSPGQDEVGGIDLNPALLDLQIKRDGNGVPLPLPQQPIGNMKIDGFLPVIINITPVTSLPLLSGIEKPQEKVPELSSL